MGDLPAPCKTYKFRFALQSDSCVDYLEHPKTMGGSPQYLVDQSRFLPGAPENLQMVGNNTRPRTDKRPPWSVRMLSPTPSCPLQSTRVRVSTPWSKPFQDRERVQVLGSLSTRAN